VISGGNDKGFTQRTINNAGHWPGVAQQSQHRPGATINNLAGGVFDLQSDQSWNHNQGGTAGVEQRRNAQKTGAPAPAPSAASSTTTAPWTSKAGR